MSPEIDQEIIDMIQEQMAVPLAPHIYGDPAQDAKIILDNYYENYACNLIKELEKLL